MPNITLLMESVNENQSALSEKWIYDLDFSFLDMVLCESRERSLRLWNNKDNKDTLRTLRGEYLIINITLGCS